MAKIERQLIFSDRLGAPWGGLLSTATDLQAFAHMFVNDGCSQSGRRVLSSAICAMMRRTSIGRIAPDCPPIGLGWFIRGKTGASKPDAFGPDRAKADTTGVVTAADIVFDRAFFGSSFSPGAIGHAGVTGCAMWADPATGIAAAILTNRPTALDDGTISGVADLIGELKG
jgi:CubicO group peptidase (beta-lactamase class C family)